MPNFRTLIILCLSLLLIVGCGTLARADDLKLGQAAYDAGEYERAFALWLPLAESGNAEAQFGSGEQFRTGRGVPKDFTKAFNWYAKAAQQGR